MDQPKSETDSGHDSPSGGSDCDDRKDSSPPSSDPSPKWALTSKPALLVLLALAGWGAWSLGYQLLLLSDTTLWFLVAFTCATLVVTHKYWRPRFDHLVKPLDDSNGNDSQRANRESRPFLDGVWQTIIAMGFMVCFLVWVSKDQQKLGRKQRFVPPPRSSSDSGNFVIPYVQKRQATATYWQTAVANFHTIRFETPTGQESFEKYQERMFQQLRSLTSTARSTSTANVDAELVQMAARHLAVDEQYLELKVKMDKLMQQERLPLPKDSVDQRMELTQVILNLLATDPKAVEALPAGPERDLVEKGLELEQTRQEQFREIEIMQATLQERYKGTAFPLPTINHP